MQMHPRPLSRNLFPQDERMNLMFALDKSRSQMQKLAWKILMEHQDFQGAIYRASAKSELIDSVTGLTGSGISSSSRLSSWIFNNPSVLNKR